MPTVLPGGLHPWNIDSGEARRIARLIRNTAENISSLRSRDLASIRSSVQEELSGLTADKLIGAIGSLDNDVKKLVLSLNDIASALLAYANRLDAADQESRDFINRR